MTIASRGATMAVDWEQRIDFARLRSQRLQKAQASLQDSALGAVLLFDQNNIRYVSSTHIGEWAKREHVFIEPAYDTEVREAGVRALGSGIPGLTRQQLTSVPLAEWEQHRDLFVYEKWIAHARAATGK